METQLSALYPRLRPFAWRLRLRDTFGYAQRTAWVPGLGLVAFQIAGHLLPLPHLMAWSFLPGAVWLGVLLLILVTWHQTPLCIARRVDQLLGLRERLSTAIEGGALPTNDPLAILQRADAVTFATHTHPKQLGWAFRRQSLAWLILPLLLGIALILVPNPQNRILAQQTAIAQSIQQTTKAIEEQKQNLLRNKEISEAERQKLVSELQALQKALQANPKSREEALARLSQTEDALRNQLDPQADARRAGLEQLAHQLEQAQHTPQAQSAQAAQAPQELTKAAQNLDKLTPQQRADLRKTLEQQASANANTNNQALAQQLQQAADALAKGDNAAASKSLQQASQTAQQTNQGLANNQAQQQTLGKLQEGRQAIAQAEQGQQTAQQGQQGQQGQQRQQSQQGQGQQAQQGQQAGQGQQGQQVGQGQQGQQAGQGGGSNANSLGNRTSNGSGNIQPNGGRGQGVGTGKNNTVYQPFTPGGQQGKQEQTTGQQGTSGQTQVSPGQYAPGQNNQPLVPYEQVYNDYHNAAEQALDSSAIPPHLKGYVRDYFTQLNPGQ